MLNINTCLDGVGLLLIIMFTCSDYKGSFNFNSETLDAGFFPLDSMPSKLFAFQKDLFEDLKFKKRLEYPFQAFFAETPMLIFRFRKYLHTSLQNNQLCIVRSILHQ
jgi:hypothetical protein